MGNDRALGQSSIEWGSDRAVDVGLGRKTLKLVGSYRWTKGGRFL